MDCERFDKNSMELLFGELDELSEAATLRHLHHCTRCRGIWSHLRTTRELAQLPLEEAPPDLFERILAAENLAHRSLPWRERFSRIVSIMAGYAMRPQLAMAVLLVLMVGSGLIFFRAHPSGNSSDSMRVVERGAPSSEPPRTKHSDPTLVYGGDADPSNQLAGRAESEGEAEPPGTAALNSPDEEGRRRQRMAYSDAMNAYQQGRYAEAERLFSEVALTRGEQAASAALHEGHAARNGSGCQRAAGIYDAVASRPGSGTVAYEASWHAASCYAAMGQTERAVGHYRNLAAQPAFAERATKALAELLPPPPSNSPKQEEQAKTADAVGARGPDTPLGQSDAARTPEKSATSGHTDATAEAP
jgi:TolA-binding protein